MSSTKRLPRKIERYWIKYGQSQRCIKELNYCNLPIVGESMSHLDPDKSCPPRKDSLGKFSDIWISTGSWKPRKIIFLTMFIELVYDLQIRCNPLNSICVKMVYCIQYASVSCLLPERMSTKKESASNVC